MLYKKILERRFRGKKVLIMGLGLQGGGAGAALFFASLGSLVRITDIRDKKDLANSLKKLKGFTYKLSLGGHKLKDFLNTDYIFKNQSVGWKNPYILKAMEKKIPILTEASLFFDSFPREKIIGVTGTKGKSTTSALICHCLKKKFVTKLAGTPQASALTILLSKKMSDFVVYELSSFNLENLRKSPRYAVITNFLTDHLDRYPNTRSYWQAKKNIFKWQKEEDKVFLSKNDPVSGRLAAGMPENRVKWFGDFNTETKQCINKSSAGAAFSVLSYLQFSKKQFQNCLADFKAPEGRIQYIATRNGVIFINDTAATNPFATAASIKEIKSFYKIPFRKMIVILGGVDKNLPYDSLEPAIGLIKHAVILPGTAYEKFLPLLKKNKTSFEETKTLKEAAEKAFLKSEKGDIIMLSPAAASFNFFKNEFDRGRQFVKIVKKLKF